jgi:hypothetical protein
MELYCTNTSLLFHSISDAISEGLTEYRRRGLAPEIYRTTLNPSRLRQVSRKMAFSSRRPVLIGVKRVVAYKNCLRDDELVEVIPIDYEKIQSTIDKLEIRDLRIQQMEHNYDRIRTLITACL